MPTPLRRPVGLQYKNGYDICLNESGSPSLPIGCILRQYSCTQAKPNMQTEHNMLSLLHNMHQLFPLPTVFFHFSMKTRLGSSYQSKLTMHKTPKDSYVGRAGLPQVRITSGILYEAPTDHILSAARSLTMSLPRTLWVQGLPSSRPHMGDTL